jgi:hypothetical protein
MSSVIKLNSSSFENSCREFITYNHTREKLFIKGKDPLLIRISHVQIVRVFENEQTNTHVVFGRVSESTFRNCLFLNEHVMSKISESSDFQESVPDSQIISNTSFVSPVLNDSGYDYIIRMEVDCSEEESYFFEKDTEEEIELKNLTKYKEIDVVGCIVTSVDELRLECNLSFVVEEAQCVRGNIKRKPKYISDD